MAKLQAVRGTHDLMGDDYTLHQVIRDEAAYCASRYNFEGISTPIFEFTDVFKRTLGETSDVVNKEMYSFESRGGDSLTLRPEFTAGIARAFISNGWQQHLPLKLFSSGPLFRYERPQKGRQRQFHQVNFEWLGGAGPEVEVQMIALASQFLSQLGIADYTLELNTLGDDESRANYREALVTYFTQFGGQLSDDSKRRLELNPLRILDSKDEGDKKLVADAPSIMEYLSNHSREHFEAVKAGLDALGIAYSINPLIVRGLDYYNDVVFEFVPNSDSVGAQSTLLAGGRYDRLVKQMGGPDTPAVGFAAGVERLALSTTIEIGGRDVIAILPSEESEQTRALELATRLRSDEWYEHVIELFPKGNFSKRLKKAIAAGAVVAVILRADEPDEIKRLADESDCDLDVLTQWLEQHIEKLAAA